MVLARYLSGDGASVTHGLLMVITVLVGFIYLTTLCRDNYTQFIMLCTQTNQVLLCRSFTQPRVYRKQSFKTRVWVV
jgi:hypothetical protein